jgi:hypothetical protein
MRRTIAMAKKYTLAALPHCSIRFNGSRARRGTPKAVYFVVIMALLQKTVFSSSPSRSLWLADPPPKLTVLGGSLTLLLGERETYIR